MVRPLLRGLGSSILPHQVAASTYLAHPRVLGAIRRLVPGVLYSEPRSAEDAGGSRRGSKAGWKVAPPGMEGAGGAGKCGGETSPHQQES